jgi:hypothetical protein
MPPSAVESNEPPSQSFRRVSPCQASDMLWLQVHHLAFSRRRKQTITGRPELVREWVRRRVSLPCVAERH